MLKPNEIEKVSMALDEPMRSLENQIMADIARRIKINGEITRSADWQIYRLHELGMAKEDIQKAIQQSLNLSDADIKQMFSDVLNAGYAHDKELYAAKGISQIPLKSNEPLQQLLSAVSEQTAGELKNISKSLGFAVKQPSGKLKFSPVAEYYQSTLDNAVTGIASGAFDYNTVIKKTVAEMTNSGLRTVDYATGWSNRVDVAARRSVMTGLSQLTAKVNEQNARELGTEYFEVTWHGGARPSHQIWQGKVYSKSQLVSVCGLGTVTGLCGSNCYHDYYPFIPGISERTYTDDQLEQMNAEERIKVEYNGKEYTKYEALQRQRKLETTMRAQRQQIKLLEDAGADEDDIINARCRYHGTSQDYTVFSKAMNLPQQRARVTADGLGNIRVEKMKKRAKYSLDPDNNRVCSARAEGWHSRAESLKSQTDKEKIKDIIPTQEQKNAIENYVSGDRMYVNHYLRDGEKAVAEMGELRKEDKELISNLEKATSIKHDNKVLYRSVDASAVFGDISQSEYDALRDKLMYGFENKNATDLIDNAVGKTVTDNGFMSTTKDKAVALDFDGFTGSENPIVIEFENADKALGFELEKHMPELDKQMEQSEVLLHNGTQYKIKGVGVAQDEYGGKSIYVKAEIVDDKLSESVVKVR